MANIAYQQLYNPTRIELVTYVTSGSRLHKLFVTTVIINKTALAIDGSFGIHHHFFTVYQNGGIGGSGFYPSDMPTNFLIPSVFGPTTFQPACLVGVSLLKLGGNGINYKSRKIIFTTQTNPISGFDQHISRILGVP